jgi:hypothetical protein
VGRARAWWSKASAGELTQVAVAVLGFLATVAALLAAFSSLELSRSVERRETSADIEVTTEALLAYNFFGDDRPYQAGVQLTAMFPR